MGVPRQLLVLASLVICARLSTSFTSSQKPSLSRSPRPLQSSGGGNFGVIPGFEVVSLDCESLKGSIRTFMIFYIMGEHPSWRADSGEGRNIEMSWSKGGKQLGSIDLLMDHEASSKQVKVRRTSGGANEDFLGAERAFLEAFLTEIEVLASDPEVDPADRLVTLSDSAIEEARESLAATSGGGGQYAKADKVLEKMDKMAKGKELKKKVEKRTGKGFGSL
jgi:hypothetical protein